MSAVGKALWFAWRVWSRCARALRYRMFASQASFDRTTSVVNTGRIVNLHGDGNRIRVGAHSVLAGELLIFAHGGRIAVGDWCFIGEGSRVWSANQVTIGDRVLISHNVNIHDCDSHPRDHQERHQHFRELVLSGHPPRLASVANAPVSIADDVWIGFNATILKGVSIGARSIVAAGSVVTRDVPEDSLFIGNSIVGKSNDASS